MDKHGLPAALGERSPLGGNLRANMDRALQFSIDCDRRRDSEFIAHMSSMPSPDAI